MIDYVYLFAKLRNFFDILTFLMLINGKYVTICFIMEDPNTLMKA